jgi:hypothetical protein
MSTDLHQSVDALVAQTAASLRVEEMTLLPFYGEIYAEVLNLAAGPDFNFVFHWGPILEPHERIVVEVLVYLAREQARQNAHASMRVGNHNDIPVEIFVEKVPASIDQVSDSRCIRYSLTQLTNLDRKKVYAALKSERLRAFFTREPSPRIHTNGRVRTTPSKFRVRVDPVPTPEQDAIIRELVATRLVEQRLGLRPVMSPSDTSLMSPVDTSVIAPYETSQHAGLMSSEEPSGQVARPPFLVSQPDTSRTIDPDVPHEHVTTSDTRCPPMGAQVTESYKVKDRIVSETAIGDGSALSGDAGTRRISQSLQAQSIEEWRRTTEELARYSARELGDTNSLGYHIQVWNHARKHDRMNGGRPVLTDGVFDILRELCERRTAISTHPSQGKAWTRRTRKWFDDNGVPMLSKTEKDEAAEIRRAIANAPFMQRESTDGSLLRAPEQGPNVKPNDGLHEASGRSWESLTEEQRVQVEAQALARLRTKMPFMFDEKGPKRTGPAYQAMLEAERNALVDEVVRCGSEPPGELE